MSYLKKIEYEIVPKDSFRVIRNCPKCSRKIYFKNTKKFRVNANGNKLDIWLIYQCEECKHSLNLSIYERQKVFSIPKEEYQCFLNFVKLHETMEYGDFEEQIVIAVNNPYQLRIRPEKQIAEILGLSRSQVKNLLEKGEMEVGTEMSQFISVSINACRFHMDK